MLDAWNRAASVLKSGWINVDGHTSTLAPNQCLITICTAQGSLFWAREVCAAQACPGLSHAVPCTHPRDWVARGRVPRSRGNWRAALWPPEAQGKPVPGGSSISVLQGGQIYFCRADGGAPRPLLPARCAGGGCGCGCPVLPLGLSVVLPWSCPVRDSSQRRRWLQVVPSQHGARVHDSRDLQLRPQLPAAAHHRAVLAPLVCFREEVLPREGAQELS